MSLSLRIRRGHPAIVSHALGAILGRQELGHARKGIEIACPSLTGNQAPALQDVRVKRSNVALAGTPVFSPSAALNRSPLTPRFRGHIRHSRPLARSRRRDSDT